MAEPTFVNEIVAGIVRDTKTWVALIGLIGAVVGSFLTIAGNLVIHCVKSKPERELAKNRKQLLTTLLQNKEWRRLSTLSKVIGATEEETKRLLISVGARGSENRRKDGEEIWGLISKHPLGEVQDAAD